MAQNRSESSVLSSSPLFVALAGWLIPGGGYWLIGERTRALTVGLTILLLFVAGILIGGIRAIQVPSYGENGGRLYIVREESRENSTGKTVISFQVREHLSGTPQPSPLWIGRDVRALLADVGNKPWSICQVLTGPVALAGGAGSIWASRPRDPANPDSTPGVLSHSRVNEIGVLYTAVAGMLNLLVIIDAAARAGRQDTGLASDSTARVPEVA